MLRHFIFLQACDDAIKLFCKNGIPDSKASQIVDNYVMKFIEPICKPEIEALRFEIKFQEALHNRIEKLAYRTPGLRELYNTNRDIMEIDAEEMLKKILFTKAARCIQRWSRRYQYNHPIVKGRIMRRWYSARIIQRWWRTKALWRLDIKQEPNNF